MGWMLFLSARNTCTDSIQHIYERFGQLGRSCVYVGALSWWVSKLTLIIFLLLPLFSFLFFFQPKMTEQMKLRGTLEGHGGWVTQIATTSEVPDMILSSSRGTCIIRSLCVTVSFGRTLFPFFEEREKTFLLCCSFSVIFASLVCSWLKSIYLVQGARHPTVCAPIRIVRTYAPCTIPPSPPPLPSFYTCGKPFFGLPAPHFYRCVLQCRCIFFFPACSVLFGHTTTRNTFCACRIASSRACTRANFCPPPLPGAQILKKREKKFKIYYVKRL